MMKKALEQRREVREMVQHIQAISARCLAPSSCVNVEAMEQMRLCQQQLDDLLGPAALALLAATVHNATEGTCGRC